MYFFFFNDTATTEIYTLSLHDALPISGAFRILAPNRDHAGAIVGYSLNVMHLGGIVCGCVLLLARLTRTKTFASLATPAALCVVLMIALTAISQYTVSARMAVLRVQMGSIQATAADSS